MRAGTISVVIRPNTGNGAGLFINNVVDNLRGFSTGSSRFQLLSVLLCTVLWLMEFACRCDHLGGVKNVYSS